MYFQSSPVFCYKLIEVSILCDLLSNLHINSSSYSCLNSHTLHLPVETILFLFNFYAFFLKFITYIVLFKPKDNEKELSHLPVMFR